MTFLPISSSTLFFCLVSSVIPKRSIVFAYLAAMLLSVVSATAAVIPPIGLAPGTQYQLIFVTADYTTPISNDINYYNSFVTDEANLNPLLPSTTWDAIVSTATANASTNAPWLGLPVYNTQGIQVNHPGESLYVGTILNPVAANQYGDGLNAAVWTGSSSIGVGSGAIGTGGYVDTLGNIGGHTMGITHVADDRWLAAGNDTTNGSAPLYALSAVITVVPETSSLILAAICLMMFSIPGIRWNRNHVG